MQIPYRCLSCEEEFNAELSTAGGPVECPSCGSAKTVRRRLTDGMDAWLDAVNEKIAPRIPIIDSDTSFVPHVLLLRLMSRLRREWIIRRARAAQRRSDWRAVYEILKSCPVDPMEIDRWACSLAVRRARLLAEVAEAEDKRAPRWHIVTTAGGSEVPAKVTANGRTYTAPYTMGLEENKNYTALFTYESGQKCYTADAVSVRADWEGLRELHVDLRELPRWHIMTTVGGREVPAKVTVNGKNHTAPHTLLLEEGKSYTAEFTYESGGKLYSTDAVSVRADWEGLRELKVNLEETNEPPIEWVGIRDAKFTGEMSRYPTTNAQYARYLNAALESGDIEVDGNQIKGKTGDYAGEDYYRLDGPGYTEYGATDGGKSRISFRNGKLTVESGLDDHPVTYVSWYGAMAFAGYYGWRLPTEEEWEGVASYGGRYEYGCGEKINPQIANYEESEHPHGTTPVGRFGTFGYGMADMAGNVDEWTSSLWSSTSSARVIRGGSWNFYGRLCAVSYRSPCIPVYQYHSYGFRVCR